MNYLFKKLQIEVPTKDAYDTLVGACLFKLGSGLILAWGSINLYFYSYFYKIQDGFTIKSASITFGFMILLLGLGAIFSIQIAEKVGFKLLIRSCGVVYILSIFICTLMNTFNGFVFFYLLLGSTAFTISAIPILNCVWSHFDTNSSGKVSGLSFFCLSLSTIFTIFLFTAIINPDNKSPSITKQEGDQIIKIFDEEISSRFQICMIIINSIQALFILPGSFKITKKINNDQTSNLNFQEMNPIEMHSQNSPPSNSNNNNNNANNNQKSYNYKIDDDEDEDNIDEENKNDTSNNNPNKTQENKILYNKNNERSDGSTTSTPTAQINSSQQNYPSLKQSMFTTPFILIYITGVLNSLYIAFLSMNFKVYASTKIDDDYFLTFILILNQVLGGIANLSFGHIIDRFCYKKTLLTIQIVIGIFAATIPIISTSKPLLLLWYVTIGMASNGLQTIMGPIFIKIFGVDTGSKLLPIKSSSFFVAVIIVQLVNVLVFSYMTYDSAITCLGIIIFLGFLLLNKLETSYSWKTTNNS